MAKIQRSMLPLPLLLLLFPTMNPLSRYVILSLLPLSAVYMVSRD